MFDAYPSPEDAMLVAALIGDLIRQLDPVVPLYALAALVAAFWHRFMWVIYLGLALAALLGWHR
jgi:hypothetical protein